LNDELSLAQLEAQLNDFDAAARQAALVELVRLAGGGGVALPPPAGVANMHCHTFFSYNAYGYSPSGLAWLARRQGIPLLGMVDFDVLDAVDEFLAACDLVDVRGSAGMETRAYVPEFATREINSPGEPGITYHMGIGFTSSSIPRGAAPVAASLRSRARERNLNVMQRVNAYLDPVTIDYAADVAPLTPHGNATERHMVLAYVRAAQRAVADAAAFWAEKLGLSRDQVVAQMGAAGDGPAMQNTIRAKLMKKGGVGYVAPSPESFPTVEEFHQLIEACGALPCITWLDGTSPGEQAMPELAELLIAKGCVALNIIPDRNWNIADPAARQLKVQQLYAVVALARELDLPLNIGTEMNAFGNKLVDDFDAPELALVRQSFLDGAYFIYGHTTMQRAAGLGYQSAWAKSHLPTRRQRNEFYTQIGRLVPPGPTGLARLRGIDKNIAPDDVLARMRTAD
jgi:hypothetical protein